MEDSEVEVFLLSVAAGLSLEEADLAVGDRIPTQFCQLNYRKGRKGFLYFK